MEQSPSWEANRFVASQEIPRVLLNLKVHYRIHNCLPLSLSWANPIQSIPPHPTSWRSSEPALYRLVTFQVPNLMSIFRSLGRTKVSVQVRGFVYKCFVTNIGFYSEELLSLRPTPKLEDHPLSAVRDCLFNMFAATLHIGGYSSIRNPRTRHAVVTGTHLQHG
jgi:hypothetical protein